MPDGNPPPVLLRRLSHALHLATQVPDAPLILSGAPTGGEALPSEAEVMARWLSQAGLAEHRLVREEQARNTLGNARHGLALAREMNAREVWLITDGVHMPRAWLFFRLLAPRGLGLRACRAPAPRERGPVIGGAVRETLALLVNLPRLTRAVIETRRPGPRPDRNQP
ncbi:YdcF family protein [Pararhodospirillum oryzae]|uniref:YdcF family protein n=1 Tax=Pararhodospirillum oryzae TaxID=478448 RepID=UPI001FEAEEB2